jgi:hypothetical protein
MNQATRFAFAGCQNFAEISAKQHQVSTIQSQPGLLLLGTMTRPAMLPQNGLDVLHKVDRTNECLRQRLRRCDRWYDK